MKRACLILALALWGCGEEKKFDNQGSQDLDGDGLGYFEDCDDTNASIGQPPEGCAAGGVCTERIGSSKPSTQVQLS